MLYRVGYEQDQPPLADDPFHNRYPPLLLMLKRSGERWRIGTFNAAIGGLTWFGPGIMGSMRGPPCR